jgi:transglutaminase-like putative cysteine protease
MESRPSLQQDTIRPLGVYILSGLAVKEHHLFAVDALRGYLVRIDPVTNNTSILNPAQAANWVDVAGLAIWEETLWFAKGEEVLWCEGVQLDSSCVPSLTPTLFTQLPYPANGVAVWDATVYVSCQKSGYIHCFERSTGQLLVRFPQPGVGVETLTATEDALWVCDRTEQTIYCLDRVTGTLKFSALTPFRSPRALAFYTPTTGQPPVALVAYADEEPYIRDDPNADFPYQLTFRDRTFIHPLYIRHHPEQGYTLSNGYLVEFSYVEELLPLEALTLKNAKWRIALPSDTVRQKIRHIEPIGHPFRIEEEEGERVAVFHFDQLHPYQSGLLGWKAVMEMYSLKYYLSPDDVEDQLPLSSDLQERYLVDNDDLAMGTDTVRLAAQAAIGTETNVIRKMLKIRNYVYEHLSYGIRPRIDTPDVVLERGIGSCGEYVGVLLALARLNGIACRSIGRYKCPPYPERRNLPLEPDFNHVWLEFYVPGLGWLPMESNVDDVAERGPYPTRFFMGLAWYHTELGKGIKFEKLTADDLPEDLSLGDLALNHIRFRILDELNPELEVPCSAQKGGELSLG